MNNPRLRFVVHRYGHHSPHSGYSRLAEYGVNEFQGEIIRVAKPLPRSIVRERMLWRLAAGTPGYDRRAMAAELDVAWRMLHERESIFHFLYGETTYRYTGLLNNLRQNRLVATFHLPPTGLSHAVQVKDHLRRLSAVVCVGPNQCDFFDGIVDKDRVFYVPLGIDTEYFTPPLSSEVRNPDLCLVVGENYRDFPTLRGVIELVSYWRPKTQFVLVASPKTLERVGRHPNLIVKSGVPEPELLELYRTASLMVLPLHEATANNAVLESMACGLPMVISDVGAIPDYVSTKSGALVPVQEARKMAEVVVELLDSPRDRERIGDCAREQAIRFAWPTVVKQLNVVYDSLS
jgi:glycosyltransferase involved in cell wall biosynthesis